MKLHRNYVRLMHVALLMAASLTCLYAQTPTQTFTWTVTGTGTETWSTTDMVNVSKTLNKTMSNGDDYTDWQKTASVSGTCSISYHISASTFPYNTSCSAGWIRIHDLTSGDLLIQDNVSGNSSRGGSRSLSIVAGHTYRFRVGANGIQYDPPYVMCGGTGSSRMSINFPDYFTNNTHTAYRTSASAGLGIVNSGDGEKNLGGFYAPVLAQSGGEVSGVIYSLACNNPNAVVFFSDTRIQTTANPNSFIIAATSGAYGGTPQTVPGSVHLERYDTGGEGVAYHDTDFGNNWDPTFRGSEGVDAYYNTATGEAQIGWTQPGEWLKYSVNVTQDANYEFVIWAACPTNGGTAHIEVDGTNATGTFNIPNTGSWTNFQPVRLYGIHVSPGFHILRLVLDGVSASGVFGVLSAIDLVAPPPTVSVARVEANTTNVVFWFADTLATNYAVGCYYYPLGGGTTNSTGTGPGPFACGIEGLQTNKAYAFNFYQRDLANYVNGPITTLNVRTLPAPPLSGYSVASVGHTNVIFHLPQPLSTNYSVAGYAVGNGVTNYFGTGIAPPAWEVAELYPDTDYTFYMYQYDLVYHHGSSMVTTNIRTASGPPALFGLVVETLDSYQAVFKLPAALTTNYGVACSYYYPGGSTNYTATGYGPIRWGIVNLRAATPYTFSFYAHNVITGMDGPLFVTNVTTKPLPDLAGLSVLWYGATNMVFQIPQALVTNYAVAGYKVVNGTNVSVPGTGPGPNVWGVTGLLPSTPYTFGFYVHDLIYGADSAPRSISATTLPRMNEIRSVLDGDHNMRLYMAGIGRTNYVLERTHSLSPANWIPLATNLTQGSGLMVFTNSPIPATNNFWRIRQQ